ncbi:MAG TPA: carbohydrate porin, partial [Longimicrobium sp.]|nr:carbohydrate porin [Longimicrobium sp.]
AGGVEREADYGGRLDVRLKVSTQGLGLWKGGTLEAKAATRYGDEATGPAGAAIPVNTALIDPARDGTETGLIALNYTHLVPFGKKPGDAVALALGRFSTFELIPDGTGITGFMNVAQIAPTHEARNVPAVTNAASAAVILAGEPVFSLMVLDPNTTPLESGLGDLFANGVTVSPTITIPTRFFGMSGHHGLRGTWSSQEITPFDAIPHFFFLRPDRPVVTEKESGGWSITYTADQYLHESAGQPHTGWRLYWQAGLADEDTNPIDRYFNVGIGGHGPFGRTLDNFGVAWAYTGFGDPFKDLFDPLARLRDEQVVEAFYNAAATRWLRLTLDLQVVRPFRPRVDTAVLPAARIHLTF